MSEEERSVGGAALSPTPRERVIELVSSALAGTSDNESSALSAAIACALLDVADAIREGQVYHRSRGSIAFGNVGITTAADLSSWKTGDSPIDTP